MLMDDSRNLPTCKLKNQKEPEFQLTVAKKLYMMQVQGRVFFFFLPLLNSDSLKYVFCKGIKFKHLGKGRKSTTPKYSFSWLWTWIVSFLLSWGQEAAGWRDDRRGTGRARK